MDIVLYANDKVPVAVRLDDGTELTPVIIPDAHGRRVLRCSDQNRQVNADLQEESV
jgi:hypothetical protein